MLQFREGIPVENVLEPEVYIRNGNTILIEEKTSKQLKVKISRFMNVVTGHRTWLHRKGYFGSWTHDRVPIRLSRYKEEFLPPWPWMASDHMGQYKIQKKIPLNLNRSKVKYMGKNKSVLSKFYWNYRQTRT